MYIRTLGAGFSFLAFIMAACSYYISRRNRCRELFSIRFMLVLLRSELSGSAAEMSVILFIILRIPLFVLSLNVIMTRWKVISESAVFQIMNHSL